MKRFISIHCGGHLRRTSDWRQLGWTAVVLMTVSLRVVLPLSLGPRVIANVLIGGRMHRVFVVRRPLDAGTLLQAVVVPSGGVERAGS